MKNSLINLPKILPNITSYILVYNNLEDLRNVILNIIDGQYDNNSEGKIVQFKPQASLKNKAL